MVSANRSVRMIRATGPVCRSLIESLEGRRLFSFSPAVSYAVGAGPEDVVSADFNGDGRLDLATTNSNGNSISVLLGNAGGTFQSALTSATGAGPQSVAVGDFNADGKMDLATSNADDVSVLLGNGNGTFQAPASKTLGATAAGVAVGDFNADGKLDLAVASNIYYPGGGAGNYWYAGAYNARVNVLLGNGAGAFAPPITNSVTSGDPIASVAVADFNGDGKLDVATADTGWFDYPHTVVAFGNGAGGISSVTNVAASNASAYGPQSVSAGDVNGDGKADLVQANTNSNIVDVMLGNGAGAFAATRAFTTGAGPTSVEMADFNGDGTIDLMTPNSGNGTVSVLLGAGSGIFQPASHLAVGSAPRSVAIGDFNGDSRPDAAAANTASNNVSVLLNDGAWPATDAPGITIGDATVTEGNSGVINATLTVSLSKASAQTVTVKYATLAGTATAGDDYNAVAATLLTFTPGQTSKTITVQVKGDQVPEFTESFSVVLSEATNAFLVDATGVVTILDNEPSITIDNVSAAEGNAGTKTFTFTLHLSAASDAPISVNYSTVEGDTDYWPYNPYSYYYGPPAATAGSDFVSKSGTVTFAAGQTAQTVTVVVNGDRNGEPNEVFSVDLAGATGARINDDHAVGTIVDDEPYVNVTGGSVTEGNSGTQLLPFTITLSNATDVPVTVEYATADGTATTAGGDYVAKSGSVTFAASETSKTVNVTVNGDRRGEIDEYLLLNLGTVTNAGVITSSATGSIIDNEPRLRVNSASVVEGNKGAKLMTFTVTLSSAYDQTVSVKYATVNYTAIAGTDYTATSGTLTFAPGETSRTFTVSIKGDKQKEWDEDFQVVLSNPSTNALLDTAYGWGTIFDDDRRGNGR